MKIKLLLAACVAFFGLSHRLEASTLYGITFPALTDLYTVDQNNGQLSSIGATGKDNLGDLTSDTRPGSERLFSVRIDSNELLQLDPATGAPISAVLLNSPDKIVSIAFDPVSGKMYGNTSLGFGAPFDALYEIDPATGNTTFIGRILFDNVFALGFDQVGNLFGVADASNDLISISTASGNGSFIANLPVAFAFDIASRPEDNKMFLADSGTFSLYTLDTGNGALSLVGPYGSAANVVGLAFLGGASVPDAGATLPLAALGLGMLGLLRFRSLRK